MNLPRYLRSAGRAAAWLLITAACAVPLIPRTSVAQLPARPAVKQAPQPIPLPVPSIDNAAVPESIAPGRPGGGAASDTSRTKLLAAPPMNVLPIDLPAALALADRNNPQMALAREQVRLALARLDAAEVLWLPSLRAGTNYNNHQGTIQQVDGTVFNTARSAFYTGIGAGTVGAQSPQYPGIYANFALSDALFQPLAARQFTRS